MDARELGRQVFSRRKEEKPDRYAPGRLAGVRWNSAPLFERAQLSGY